MSRVQIHYHHSQIAENLHILLFFQGHSGEDEKDLCVTSITFDKMIVIFSITTRHIERTHISELFLCTFKSQFCHVMTCIFTWVENYKK